MVPKWSISSLFLLFSLFVCFVFTFRKNNNKIKDRVGHVINWKHQWLSLVRPMNMSFFEKSSLILFSLFHSLLTHSLSTLDQFYLRREDRKKRITSILIFVNRTFFVSTRNLHPDRSRPGNQCTQTGPAHYRDS